MSRQHKTARGKMIDMAALAARNERTRAVGNILMNARGDRLNPDGTVKYTVEELARMDQNTKAAPVQTAISDPKPLTQPAPVVSPEPIVEPEEFDPEPLDAYNDTRLTTANDGEGEDTGYPAPEVEPEAVSKITKTRDDGSRYMEIEYDDGSIETVELDEE